MKCRILIALIVIITQSAFPFTDETHFSQTFNEERYFRVFTPPDYNSSDLLKKYPVIYYFHGCGGSYQQSGTYSYEDHGLVAPNTIVENNDPSYGYPNNADFENFVYHHQVIIVSVDGRINNLPGCGVYFPSQVDSWQGNYYNFSAYIKELISTVDARYHTKTDATHRAISGLSMGGNMALWVAATNPQLFNSLSEFCHSPTYYDVGDPAYQTTVDVMQLWRNYRGLRLRHTTTDRDYLKYYTEQMASNFMGAGFHNDYYLADYCKHHAARVDLQFKFHMNSFNQTKLKPACFSTINLYPEFETWDYRVSSNKRGNGWIYLRDVSRNGLGIYTRKRLPYGKSLSEFNITVTTPVMYTPDKTYLLSRYSYKDDRINHNSIKADAEGKLAINTTGGMGEEIGIIGDDLQPPIFILTDTINENIYLQPGIKTPISFDMVNLSNAPQEVAFTVTSGNNDLLAVISQTKTLSIPAFSKLPVDSLAMVQASQASSFNNVAYIKIGLSIGGVVQDREHIVQVVIRKIEDSKNCKVKVFDGRSEEIELFHYEWNGWGEPISSGTISEGKGNGNGKAEFGETFSIWIQPPSAFDHTDTITWHPTIPIIWKKSGDVSLEKMVQHRFNTGKSVLSGQIRMNRRPTKSNPIRVPVQAEYLKVEYLENDCHRNTADNYTLVYYDLLIHEDGSVAMEPR